MMNETDLLHLFIMRVPFVFPTVRVERRNIINVETRQGFRVRNGIKGQADAFATVDGGLHVELETKAARGVLADAQKAWRAACLKRRIPHLVLRARKGEAPNETVDRWIVELGEVIAQ